MSYSRFSEEGSDVYIYPDVAGGITCCGCCLLSDDSKVMSVRLRDEKEALIHLLKHRRAGHTLPERTVWDIIADMESSCLVVDEEVSEHLGFWKDDPNLYEGEFIDFDTFKKEIEKEDEKEKNCREQKEDKVEELKETAKSWKNQRNEMQSAYEQEMQWRRQAQSQNDKLARDLEVERNARHKAECELRDGKTEKASLRYFLNEANKRFAQAEHQSSHAGAEVVRKDKELAAVQKRESCLELELANHRRFLNILECMCLKEDTK